MLGPDAPNPTLRTMPRELDSRTSDGIHVRLLWDPQDDRLAVSVEDIKTGGAFEIGVEPGQRALDVFHHPYAYAAEAPAIESTRGQRFRLPT